MKWMPIKALLLVVQFALLAGSALAVERVRVMALFSGKAALNIDGTQRVLRAGQRSPEGVKLIRADSRSALLEIDGEVVELGLNRTIGGRYRELGSGEEVRIYRNPRGMFTTVGSINGLTVNFLVDTGASQVAMSSVQARRLGLDFRVEGDRGAVTTASGYARAFRVTLDSVKVGAIELRNVEAMVLEGEHPKDVLLGMSFLGRVTMTNSERALILKKKY
ncbi:MAG: TIGR02281 family clan AA aspartic protease [Gammaproteobacteria bacterium]